MRRSIRPLKTRPNGVHPGGYKKQTDERTKNPDFWKFTYLANGINMMDIAALKWRTVQDESILFSRGETRRTSRKAANPIVIIRNEIIDQILVD